MKKNHIKRRKNQRPSGRIGGKVIGLTRPGVTGMYSEKSRFPSLPREFQIALPFFYHDERTGGQTSQATRRWPLCEFDTQLPRYAAELYQIYRHARIMAIDVKMEVVNTSSTEPLIAAIGCLPLVNVAAITDPKTIISVPGTVYKQIGLSTGMSRATLTKRFITDKMLGELTIGSNTYLQTYSEALSSAIWTELPCIYAGVIGARTGATWTGIIDYRAVFHIRFSELNVPALGYMNLSKASQPFTPKPQEIAEDDEEEWIQPPILKRTKKGPGSINSSNLTR